MGLNRHNVAKLTLEDGRFKLKVRAKNKTLIRYPKVVLKKNTINVGCISVSKDAAFSLLERVRTGQVGYIQAEDNV